MSTDNKITASQGLFDNKEVSEIVKFCGCQTLEEITSSVKNHFKEEKGNTNAIDGMTE